MHLSVALEWIMKLMAMKSLLKWGFVTPRQLIKTFVIAFLLLLIASWIGGVISVFNVFTIVHGNRLAFNVLTVVHGNRRPFNHYSISCPPLFLCRPGLGWEHEYDQLWWFAFSCFLIFFSCNKYDMTSFLDDEHVSLFYSWYVWNFLDFRTPQLQFSLF